MLSGRGQIGDGSGQIGAGLGQKGAERGHIETRGARLWLVVTRKGFRGAIYLITLILCGF